MSNAALPDIFALELHLETLTEPQAREFARAEAAKHTAADLLVVNAFGMLTLDGFYYHEVLENKYEIKVLHFGCVVTENTISYIRVYNEVSETEIRRRFGDNIFSDAQAAAVERIEREHSLNK